MLKFKKSLLFFLCLFLLLFVGAAGTSFAVDVQISQLTDNPDPAIRGGQITYSIFVENNADDTAHDVVLTFPLPDTTSFVSVSDGRCSHDGGAPGTVTCTFGDLVGTLIGGPVIQVDTVIRTSGATGEYIDVEAEITTSDTDTNEANNTATQNTTIDDGADLVIAKTDSPDSVIAGGNVTYTITVTNNGPNNASSITVTDTLPTNMTYQPPVTGSGWSCAHNAVNPGGVVTCTRSSINNGITAPVITLVGTVTGAITGTITNTVTVSAATGDPDTSNNTTTQNTEVTLGTDLSITKVTVGAVIGGQTATFTLLPRNLGPYPADNVQVTDTLPTGFAYINATGTGWTCSAVGQDITCTRPTYAAGGADNITVQATAPASGTNITNTTVITSTPPAPGPTPDPNLSNNTGSVTFNIVPDGANLSISKTKTPNPVAQGSNITSTIRVTNNGPDATSGILTVTDTLSAGETYVSGSGTNWSCGHTGANPGGVVTCEYRTGGIPSGTPMYLASGASTSVLTIITTATGAGDLTNNACASDVGGQPDGVSGNDCAIGTVTSTAEIADLTITKSANAGGDGNTTLSVSENTIIYTINVINNGPNAATGIVLTDTIAGYVSASTGVAVTSSPANYTCTTGSTVTCTQQSGSLASGAMDQFVIQVSRPLFDGSQTNTATVNSTLVGDPDRTNNSATATVTVEPICDVQMQSKTVSPATVRAGTEATYVLTFRNNGPSTAANVVVTDNFNLPAGGDTNFTFISATPTEGSCSWVDGTKILTCSGITLNNGESRTVTVIIRPNWQSGDPTRTINNTAAITTDTTESNPDNNTRTATLTVTASDLDLLVNKTDLVDPIGYEAGVPANNTINYLVRITNRGASLATGLVLTDAMTPKSGKTLTFRGDWADAGGTIGPNLCDNVGTSVTGPATQSITCNFPDLAANTPYDRYLRFEVITAPDPAGDTHNNIATVHANEHDRLLANNSESESSSVRMRVDLSVAKAPALNPVQLRQPFNWTITVTNNGPGDSTQTNLTDTLPAGMAFYGDAPSWIKTGTSPGSGTCTINGQNLTCAFGMLSSGGVTTITVPVRVTSYPSGGTTTNCATATTDQFDPDAANNTNRCGTVTVQRSSLAGYVYSDLNDNGSMDGGETGISGVTLTLTGTDAYGNAVNVTTTTNGFGFYRFNNLSPSDGAGYTVTETQPPIYYFDGLDRTPAGVIPGSRTTDIISNINVPANTALTGYLFGEIPAASISGYVWNDENNNGVREAGETTGIPNVQITLTGTDINGPVSMTTTTDANGAYSFGPLRAGTYTVTETQPAAWADGLDSAGSAGGTAGNDIITDIVLSATTIATNYNFGELGGSLAGIVYNDLNDNGIREPAEPGIPNVTVTLTGTDINSNSINRVTTTAADGSYRFSNLPMPNGSGYTITETQPAGWIDGEDTLGTLGGTLGNDVFSAILFPIPGAVGTGYNFGERQGTAGIAQVSGKVWLDTNHNRIDDDGNGQTNWTVELIQRADPLDNTNYTLIATTVTNSAGEYAFNGLSPGNYEIRFRYPTTGYTYGIPISGWSGVDLTYGTIRNLVLIAGDNATNQNLPLDPGGVIYDAMTRLPVAGATVTISGPLGFNPVLHLVGSAANASQTTDATGRYQFLLHNSGPDIAPSGIYTLTITTYPAGYLPINSIMIPPCVNTLTVGSSPDPALVQNNDGPPTSITPGVCPANASGLVAGAGTTQYYLLFLLTPGTSANVLNNHIPIDPILGGAIIATKSTPLVNVKRGDLVPYTMTMTNTLPATLANIDVVDIIPPGFKYRTGSARLNGFKNEPVITGRQLTWRNLSFAPGEKKTFTIILVVGAGVGEGEYTNQVYAANNIINTAVSNVATATVRVIPDPTFDCTDVIGKVFDDKNTNGYQDEGEPGIANVRLATARGLIVTTDAEGRFHIPCALVPQADRGSNFIMKVDERTLPSGFRMTTENPYTVRATRGKMIKMNFGAAIHRVVRIDVNDAAFEPDSENLRSEWQEKMQALENTLRESPTVVRLAYRMNKDSKSLVKKRIKAMRKMLTEIWKKGKNCPPLIFEEEIVEAKQ